MFKMPRKAFNDPVLVPSDFLLYIVYKYLLAFLWRLRKIAERSIVGLVPPTPKSLEKAHNFVYGINK